MKETMNTPEELNIPSKRRKRYGWLWLFASPFILFALLCVLLYLPPVQWFAVNKASEVASDMTGMDIRVGRLSLRFPLDLVVEQARELADLAVKLDEAGSHGSYQKVMAAVACFEQGNAMLAEVLKELGAG